MFCKAMVPIKNTSKNVNPVEKDFQPKCKLLASKLKLHWSNFKSGFSSFYEDVTYVYTSSVCPSPNDYRTFWLHLKPTLACYKRQMKQIINVRALLRTSYDDFKVLASDLIGSGASYSKYHEDERLQKFVFGLKQIFRKNFAPVFYECMKQMQLCVKDVIVLKENHLCYQIVDFKMAGHEVDRLISVHVKMWWSRTFLARPHFTIIQFVVFDANQAVLVTISYVIGVPGSFLITPKNDLKRFGKHSLCFGQMFITWGDVKIALKYSSIRLMELYYHILKQRIQVKISSFRSLRDPLLIMRWMPLSKGMIKFNFDASYKKGDTGVGIVGRDHYGGVVLVRYGDIKAASSSEAELKAGLYTMKIALEHNFFDSVIEGDCASVVEVFGYISFSPFKVNFFGFV